ncbi:hypothetical protein LIA77_09331 [Sarocladium implicatum]|nr:hypothetical protein LIA77_09331 [Sarocladium implicatum]
MSTDQSCNILPWPARSTSLVKCEGIDDSRLALGQGALGGPLTSQSRPMLLDSKGTGRTFGGVWAEPTDVAIDPSTPFALFCMPQGLNNERQLRGQRLIV